MLKSIEGQRVPQVTFRTRRDHEWVDLTSDDVFAGKTVIVFSLPGAFTPTCSSSHVPRYNQLEPLFRARDIDDVVCVSVNDAFVMDEWKRSKKRTGLPSCPMATVTSPTILNGAGGRGSTCAACARS